MITRGRETVRRALLLRRPYQPTWATDKIVEHMVDRVMAGERIDDAWRNEFRDYQSGLTRWREKENPA